MIQVKPSSFRYLFLAVGMVLPPACYAQDTPSAGRLQQQIERDQQLNKKPQALPKPTAPTNIATPTSGQTVVVNAFKFEGNTLLSNDELQAAVAPLLGRALDFAKLQSSALVVGDLYRSKGWVVQAYLPEQDITQGVVTIAITEAVFGQTLIAGAPAALIFSKELLSIFAHQQKSDQFVDINAIDRALLLADDLPGVKVSGALSQGSKAGQTDLVLQLADEPRANGSFMADNTGAVSTGTQRVLATANINSPTLRGDVINLSGMLTLGSQYLRAAYSVPVTPYGVRFGVNASRLDYQLISDDYKSLKASGNSTASGIELSYPMVRSRTFNLNTSLTADKKDFYNVSGENITSAYNNMPVSLGISGNSFDAWGGGGANALTLVFMSGQLNLNGSPNQAADASTTQTEGNYGKARYSLSRQQQINPQLSFYTALSGQWANKNLDSSEKFYLGGSSGVRAYPTGEGGGTLGHMLNLELRWQMAESWNLTGFYDYGGITNNIRNDFAGASPINTYTLDGAGMVLSWRNSAGAAVQATYAKRLADNPNPITTPGNYGADQDGTRTVDRFWISASLAF